MTRNSVHSEEAYVQPTLEDPLEEDLTVEGGQQHDTDSNEPEDSVAEQDVAGLYYVRGGSSSKLSPATSPTPLATEHGSHASVANVTEESVQEPLPQTANQVVVAGNRESTFAVDAVPTWSGRV